MAIISIEQEIAPQQEKGRTDEKKTSGDCWLDNDEFLCSVLNCSMTPSSLNGTTPGPLCEGHIPLQVDINLLPP